jgi:hypothetical protein
MAPGTDLPPDPTAQELARQLHKERKELEALRKERVEVLQGRLAVHVLQIDAKTGKLFDLQGKEIAAQADALALIDRDRTAAGTKDLYYLMLWPKKETGYPTPGQIRRYDEWFGAVSHGFEKPPETGKREGGP